MADGDVRDALCRALVGAGLGVLEVSRLRDLETTFRALVGDNDDESGGRRRSRKRRADAAKAASEPAPAASAPTASEAVKEDT
jgi:hypothetical protein